VVGLKRTRRCLYRPFRIRWFIPHQGVLAVLAKKYLAVPASNAPSERAFLRPSSIKGSNTLSLHKANVSCSMSISSSLRWSRQDSAWFWLITPNPITSLAYIQQPRYPSHLSVFNPNLTRKHILTHHQDTQGGEMKIQVGGTTSFSTLFVYAPHWGEGCKVNIVCTQLCHQIRRLKTSNGPESEADTLLVQADNAGSENKNKNVLAFLSMLVFHGWYRRVYFNFLVPGHTHCLRCFAISTPQSTWTDSQNQRILWSRFQKSDIKPECQQLLT
jgi:hypothetical protein